MTKVKLNILTPHTQWGDRLYFADSLHNWTGYEVTTTSRTFPWWQAEITLPVGDFDCKCYIQRGSERLWETFEGNRHVQTNEQELAIKFNEKEWSCVVCEDVLTNQPVLCSEGHPYHHECFEAYLNLLLVVNSVIRCTSLTWHIYFNAELSRNNVNFTCLMKCNSAIRTEVSYTISPLLKLRYDRVKNILEGACVECPNGSCQYMIPKPDPATTLNVLLCPSCSTEWCRFCEKELVAGESFCSICAEGLRSVFQDILDAVEEAAGTMCPQCKNRGQKYLEECTHITCDCGAQFCYCCGVGKDEVDTADPSSSDINRLYGHNEDWESNQDTRCPMWLSDLASLYLNWPDDPHKQQKRFHEIRAQKKLEQVRAKTPNVEWTRVLELDQGLNMQVEKFMRKTHAVY